MFVVFFCLLISSVSFVNISILHWNIDQVLMQFLSCLLICLSFFFSGHKGFFFFFCRGRLSVFSFSFNFYVILLDLFHYGFSIWYYAQKGLAHSSVLFLYGNTYSRAWFCANLCIILPANIKSLSSICLKLTAFKSFWVISTRIWLEGYWKLLLHPWARRCSWHLPMVQLLKSRGKWGPVVMRAELGGMEAFVFVFLIKKFLYGFHCLLFSFNIVLWTTPCQSI